jgi:hypothetical protein
MVDFEYFAGRPGTGPTFLMMPGSYVSTEWQLDAAAATNAAADGGLSGSGSATGAYERPPIRAAAAGGRS